MAEERKRTTRARSTSSNSTSRRSASAKQSSQRAKRATNNGADSIASSTDSIITPQAEDTTDTTLGEETWRPEMTDGDAVSADDAALESTLQPPVAEFDGAATDDATPAQHFVSPDTVTRAGDDRMAGLDDIATPMTTGESAFTLDDRSVTTQKETEPTPLPRTQGKTTAPMPMTTGKPTVPMPMQQVQSTTPPMMQPQSAKARGLPFDERWLTLIGGGALTVAGMVRRGWPGAIMGIAGVGLLTRGIIQTVRGKKQYAAITVDRSITINRSQADVYHFWRTLENLPRFMAHLDAVTVVDAQRSHWRAKAPAGTMVAWDAIITEDEPNTRIAWESAHNAQVQNAGIVTFAPAPGGRGTEVHVRLRYLPPAGKLGALVAALFGENPDQQVHADLQRLKEVLETGEIPTTAGQPSGRGH